MSEFKQFDFATANTTNSSVNAQEPHLADPSGLESLPRIDQNNGSHMRTAFGTSKAKSKFEILRKQSIQSSQRMSVRFEGEADRVLVWDTPGPALSVN